MQHSRSDFRETGEVFAQFFAEAHSRIILGGLTRHFVNSLLVESTLFPSPFVFVPASPTSFSTACVAVRSFDPPLTSLSFALPACLPACLCLTRTHSLPCVCLSALLSLSPPSSSLPLFSLLLFRSPRSLSAGRPAGRLSTRVRYLIQRHGLEHREQLGNAYDQSQEQVLFFASYGILHLKIGYCPCPLQALYMK